MQTGSHDQTARANCDGRPVRGMKCSWVFAMRQRDKCVLCSTVALSIFSGESGGNGLPFMGGMVESGDECAVRTGLTTPWGEPRSIAVRMEMHDAKLVVQGG